MLRTRDAEEANEKVDLFGYLPEELARKIWRYVFREIGRVRKNLYAALRTRYVSRCAMQQIETYLFGELDGKDLYAHIVRLLRDDTLLLFTKVKSLCMTKSYLTVEGLQKMTWLNTLQFSDTYLSSEPFLGLKQIKRLELHRTTHAEKETVTRFTHLDHLFLSSNACVTDTELACLSQLKSLELWYDRVITGKCFSKLVTLEHLVLASMRPHRTETFDEAMLCYVAPSLRSLHLVGYLNVTDASISTLTNLHTLVLDDNQIITGSVLRQLTQLTSLSLCFEELIESKDLSCLTRLQALTVFSCRSIDGAHLKPLSHTLRKLHIQRTSYVDLLALLEFEQLQSLSYSFRIGEDKEIAALFSSLRERGIYVSHMPHM